MSAVHEWKVARAKLADAAQAFTDACANVNGTALELSGNPRAQEAKILEICSGVPLVKAITKDIAESSALINRVTNMSMTLTPINRLPPEVLSQVFVLATCAQACGSDRRPHPVHMLTIIPSVCTRWREIAIGTCSIWSHIDMHLDIGLLDNEQSVFDRAKLWLDRARGVPIHLHISRKPPTSHNTILEILALILPHMQLVSSLNIGHLSDVKLTADLLRHFIFQCQPGSLSVISIESLFYRTKEQTLDIPLSGFRSLVHLELVKMVLDE